MKKISITLIELVLVIAVIVIILGLLFPAVTSREPGSRQSSCMNNLKQIGMALHMYAQDYKENFPEKTVGIGNDGGKILGYLYPKYAGDLRIFDCPSASSDKTKRNDPIRELINYNYCYKDGLDETAASDGPIAADKGAGGTLTADSNHGVGGVNVLYVDGHVAWMAGSTPTGERQLID